MTYRHLASAWLLVALSCAPPPPTCADGVRNGAETDIDCGGPACGPCAASRSCSVPTDCTSGLCAALVCQAPTCADGVKNAAETDIDCGGPACRPCAVTRACAAAGDCTSGVCMGQVCQVPACADSVKNGGETDVDCGGVSCKPCAAGRACAAASDCAAGICTARLCQAATCLDGVKNGGETDVDCGGTSCKSCALGQACAVLSDCGGALCSGGRCRYPQSCAELHGTQPALGSGTYALQPDPVGVGSPLQAYCDMSGDGGGWTLVYKLSAGVAADASALWLGAPLNEDQIGYLNLVKSSGHYVNRIATSYWNAAGFSIKEARVTLYAGGTPGPVLRFNVTNADRLAWFTPLNLVQSPWSDLRTASLNYFGIVGDNSARKWFINSSYGGCSVDTGWLGAFTATTGCAWESSRGSGLVLQYAAGATAQNWTTGNIGVADVLTVFVR